VFGAVAGSSVLPGKERSDPSGAGPSDLCGQIAEKFMLHGDGLALLEGNVRSELTSVARDVGKEDREALAVRTARNGIEVHVPA